MKIGETVIRTTRPARRLVYANPVSRMPPLWIETLPQTASCKFDMKTPLNHDQTSKLAGLVMQSHEATMSITMYVDTKIWTTTSTA